MKFVIKRELENNYFEVEIDGYVNCIIHRDEIIRLAKEEEHIEDPYELIWMLKNINNLAYININDTKRCYFKLEFLNNFIHELHSIISFEDMSLTDIIHHFTPTERTVRDYNCCRSVKERLDFAVNTSLDLNKAVEVYYTIMDKYGDRFISISNKNILNYPYYLDCPYYNEFLDLQEYWNSLSYELSLKTEKRIFRG